MKRQVVLLAVAVVQKQRQPIGKFQRAGRAVCADDQVRLFGERFRVAVRAQKRQERVLGAVGERQSYSAQLTEKTSQAI